MTSMWRSRSSRGLTLAASVTIAVLAPVEIVFGEELVRPDMLFLLGLSSGGLALGLWSRTQRTT